MYRKELIPNYLRSIIPKSARLRLPDRLCLHLSQVAEVLVLVAKLRHINRNSRIDRSILAVTPVILALQSKVQTKGQDTDEAGETAADCRATSVERSKDDTASLVTYYRQD